MCHLSPADVDAMGWFDLIGLTLMADNEIDNAKTARGKAKEAQLAAMTA